MAIVTSVNSLDLPALLLELIERDRWRSPDDHSIFDKLFHEHSGVTFHSPSQMEKETTWWLSLAPDGSILRGRPDLHNPPGDIEPSLTVLIGDVGVGLDAPFALDYRTSRVNISLQGTGDANRREWRPQRHLDRDRKPRGDVLNGAIVAIGGNSLSHWCGL